jgi:autotransporter translocation and assembly factor TamB
VASIDLDALPWRALAAKLPAGAPDVSSIEVSGDARVALQLSQPSLLELRIEARKLAVEVGERHIAASPFTVEVGARRARITDFTLLTGGEALSVEGVLALAETGDSRLRIEGKLPLDLAELWVPEAEIEGRLDLSLALEGSVRDPRLTGPIQIANARVAYGPSPDGTPRAIESLRMSAVAVGSRVEIETLEGEVLGGALRASGVVPLPAADPSSSARLRFDVSGVNPV